jgi:hypothetical protein
MYAFLTTMLDGGEWSTSRPIDFPLEQRPPLVLIGWKVLWGLEMVWMWWQTDISQPL